MAAPSKPILGIDVRASGIWVVEMRGTWPDAQIANAAYAALPPNAFDGGKLVEKKVVGQILKDLVESMRTSAGEAILSVQELSVDVRVMEVPQVPDSELRMVIEGELAHYQIFANQAIALDFIRMAPGEDAIKESPQVLVVAAEKGAVETCTQLAETAELNIVAVEPVLCGQYRAAMLTLGRQTEDALIVSIGDTHTEIAILGQGNIRLYRRANFGANRLISITPDGGFPSSLGSWIHMQTSPDTLTSADGSAAPLSIPETLNREAVSGLAMEIRRSLEYYFSQSPKAQSIVQGILSAQNKDLQPLCGVLSQALNIRMDMAGIPQSWFTDPAIAEKVGSQNGLAYMGASGVAMRHLTGVPASIPEFSLTPKARDDGRLQDMRKRLVLALVASIVSLFAGIVLSLNLGTLANGTEAQLKSATGQLLGLQRIKQTRLESTLRQNALHKTLKSQGYQMPRIMDAISRSMAPESSLAEVTVNADGRVVLSGEASTEKAIIETLESLKLNTFLEGTLLDSFGKTGDVGKVASLERFQVTSHLAGSRSSAPPPTP